MGQGDPLRREWLAAGHFDLNVSSSTKIQEYTMNLQHALHLESNQSGGV